MRALEIGAEAIAPHSPYETKGVSGLLFHTSTNLGTQVQVWRADLSVEVEQYRYFCHGAAFATYKSFDYTVMSGDAKHVLADEYTLQTSDGKKGQRFSNALPAEEAETLQTFLADAVAGTVLAWEDAKRTVVHTARFFEFVAAGTRTAGNTVMMTKNGFNALKRMHLSEVCVVYKELATHFQFWTPGRAGGGCVIL